MCGIVVFRIPFLNTLSILQQCANIFKFFYLTFHEHNIIHITLHLFLKLLLHFAFMFVFRTWTTMPTQTAQHLAQQRQ